MSSLIRALVLASITLPLMAASNPPTDSDVCAYVVGSALSALSEQRDRMIEILKAQNEAMRKELDALKHATPGTEQHH